MRGGEASVSPSSTDDGDISPSFLMDTMDESDADEEVNIPILPVKRKTKVSDTDLETVIRFVKKKQTKHNIDRGKM